MVGVLEVAPSGEPPVGLRPRALVQSNPLRTRIRYLRAAPVRDLEPQPKVDVAVAQLRDGPIEVLDAVDEDWLVAVEMPREQERRRIRGQPHHRHACSEGLDREYELRTQPPGEVLQVGGDVPARQVDEVKLIEHSQTEAAARLEVRETEVEAMDARLRTEKGSPDTTALLPTSPPSQAPDLTGLVRL